MWPRKSHNIGENFPRQSVSAPFPDNPPKTPLSLPIKIPEVVTGNPAKIIIRILQRKYVGAKLEDAQS